LTKELKPSSGKKIAFSTNGAGSTGGQHVEECKLIHSFFFKILFIYFMYVSTLLLSSDTPEEGIRSPLQMVASHRVVAGI